MSIKDLFIVVQIIIALAIIALIMMQNRGSGLSGVFGGEAAVFRTRRGAEKLLLYATVFLSTLFFFLSLFLVWYR